MRQEENNLDLGIVIWVFESQQDTPDNWSNNNGGLKEKCIIKTDLPRNCNESHQKKLSTTSKESQEIAEYKECDTVTEKSFRKYYPKIWYLVIRHILI